MKVFSKYIFKVFLITFVSAYFLDTFFTFIFKNSEPYTKAQYIHSIKNQKFDYIFIGSSRVENSIVPEIIYLKTNKRALNLGISALKLKDISFLIKLLNEFNIKGEKFFIQVDYSYNNVEDYSKFFSSELLPYLGTSETIDKYLELTNNNYSFLKNIPFLKYSSSEQLIGFRKIFLSSLKRTTIFEINKGYKAIYGSSTNVIQHMPEMVKENKFQFEIESFAKNKNLNLFFFTTPVSKNTKNLLYFKRLNMKIPNLLDLHDVIKQDKYFNDNCHLNDDGAKLFTNILIKKINL